MKRMRKISSGTPKQEMLNERNYYFEWLLFGAVDRSCITSTLLLHLTFYESERAFLHHKCTIFGIEYIFISGVVHSLFNFWLTSSRFTPLNFRPRIFSLSIGILNRGDPSGSSPPRERTFRILEFIENRLKRVKTQHFCPWICYWIYLENIFLYHHFLTSTSSLIRPVVFSSEFGKKFYVYWFFRLIWHSMELHGTWNRFKRATFCCMVKFSQMFLVSFAKKYFRW